MPYSHIALVIMKAVFGRRWIHISGGSSLSLTCKWFLPLKFIVWYGSCTARTKMMDSNWFIVSVLSSSAEFCVYKTGKEKKIVKNCILKVSFS